MRGLNYNAIECIYLYVQILEMLQNGKKKIVL